MWTTIDLALAYEAQWQLAAPLRTYRPASPLVEAPWMK